MMVDPFKSTVTFERLSKKTVPLNAYEAPRGNLTTVGTVAVPLGQPAIAAETAVALLAGAMLHAPEAGAIVVVVVDAFVVVVVAATFLSAAPAGAPFAAASTIMPTATISLSLPILFKTPYSFLLQASCQGATMTARCLAAAHSRASTNFRLCLALRRVSRFA